MMNDNSNNSNRWQYIGQIKLPVQLRSISNGKTMLPITLENGSTNINFVCFSPLSDQLSELQQGQTISVTGYMKNRKCEQCGHYHVNLIAKSVSLDNGHTWLSDDQQNHQQHPQQQPLQQAIQGFQQPPRQQQPKQSREEFLSTNQYRQQSAQGQQGKMTDLLNNRTPEDSPVTPAAMEAQTKLYSQNQPIDTQHQAEASLQRYQANAQQAPVQDNTQTIDFDATSDSTF